MIGRQPAPSGGPHGTFRRSGEHRSRNRPVTDGASIADRQESANSEKKTWKTQEDSDRIGGPNDQAEKRQEENPLSRGPQTHLRGRQAPLGCAEKGDFLSCRIRFHFQCSSLASKPTTNSRPFGRLFPVFLLASKLGSRLKHAPPIHCPRRAFLIVQRPNRRAG